MLKQKPADYFLVLVSLVGYYFLGYVIPRYHTLPLFATYGILFLVYLWILKDHFSTSIIFWVVASLACRSVLLFSLPQLSDDFYRFIWDGRLWAAGHHPFAALPAEYLSRNISGVDQELYNHLNSKPYFAIYPPVAQYVFWVAVKISPGSIAGSVVAMRMIILLAEGGSLLLIHHLLKKFNLPAKNILLYALNPLIIIELAGNLHFEAVVIFFVLFSVFLFARQKIILSAASLSVAICAKLIPLIFLPAFFGRMTRKKLFIYFSVIVVTCLLIFIPFLNREVINTWQSVGLYFNKFEFNASLYYLVREWGYSWYGYNIIQTVGWKLAFITFILIMTFTWIRNRQSQLKQVERDEQSFFLEWMWMLSIYFLFTTTLHPWYISILLALSVFTPYRFVVIWTGLIFLTYAGYTLDTFKENLWLTAIEYLAVAGYLGYELWGRRGTLYFQRRKPVSS